MNPQTALLRKIYSIFILFGLTIVFLLWQFSAKAELTEVKENLDKSAKLDNYDIRTDKNKSAGKAIAGFIEQAAKTASIIEQNKKRTVSAKAELRSKIPNLKIEYNNDLRIPEIISPDFAKSADFLTAPSNQKRAGILRNFLKQNSALFGLSDPQIENLQTTADYTNPDGNLAFVQFEQRINEIPVFRGEVKAGFTRKNELIRIVNNLAPNLDYESLSTDFGSPEQAVESSARHIGLQTNETDTKRIETTSNELKITFERGQFADITTAEKMYFPVETGVARPAWRVLLWTKTDAYYVIVDAADGTLLWSKDITQYQTQPATYNVYGSLTSMMKAADSPTPSTPGCLMPNPCPQPPIIARQNFTLIGNEPPYTFNNNGWIPDGENRTIGNNAEAGIDRMSPNGIDDNGWAFGNPNRNFVYTYNPAPGNPPPGEEPVPTTQTYPPSQFQQGSITNAFYTVNRWHDEVYLLGFTEASRNFQTDNFGRGGNGNDSISVEVQDSSGTGGANFSTSADGTRGRLQLFIWAGPTPDRDGALDNQVIVHELTHGLSNRLHGNGTGLSTNMAGGMGEGWGDFYALSLLSEPTDDVNGVYSVGCYSTYLLGGMESNCYYGIRRFPIARISAHGPNGLPYNPLTFRYVNSNCDTLIGTTSTNPNSAYPRNPVISTSSTIQPCDQVHNLGEIWSAALWEVRGFLIEAHGAAEGNRRALQYITDGMKLAPLGPTMLQERDAIIAATFASDPSDVLAVKRGFAARGMGVQASIQNPGTGNNNTAVTESFESVSNVVIGPGFSLSDTTGNNNGFPEQGENVLISVPVTNTSGSGTINNVVISITGGGSASYGSIPDGATVTRQIPYTVPVDAPCGSDHTINITGTSALGNLDPKSFSFRIGIPVGGPSVTFTSSAPVRIPGTGTGPGPADVYPTTINVSGLTGNKKIKLELTNLNATYPGDMDWLLVGPGGQKFVVMSDAISAFTTQTNAVVVLKDDAASGLPDVGTVNMNGEWKPTDWNTGTDTFAAPAPAPPYQSPAPTGTATFASLFGTASSGLNGTWSLYGVDDVNGDFATISGWKLTFENNDYMCTICRLCTPPRTRGDFDGDGKTDLSVFRPSEGNWYLNRSTAGFVAFHWGLSTDTLVPGDYDGDGKADLAIWRVSTGEWFVLRSSDGGYSAPQFGLAGDVPVQGDYDGDGKADLAVFRPSTNIWYIANSGTGSTTITAFGAAGDVPVRGDYNGDGKTDIAIFRPSANQWWIANSGGATTATTFGAAGDKLVPADYDGDNKEDIAIYRPSTGTWWILRSSDGVVSTINFGVATDIPVPGDYDGDGKDDQAIYRNGTWWLNQSTTGVVSLPFGLSTDTALPARYIP